MILTRTSINTLYTNDYWNKIIHYNNMTSNEKITYLHKTYNLLYWINADRFYWNSGDAQNLAEAFFAMGNVASICRICFLLPIIGFVGPLQVNICFFYVKIFILLFKVMLERMIIDISKWIVIILIFFIAFACSLFLIFSYFSVSLQLHNDLHLLKNQNPSELQINTIIKNDYLLNNTKCPLIFYNLTDQKNSYFLNYRGMILNNNDQNNNDNNTCSQVNNYNKIKKIGSYPAMYYFGRSFGSTILTTFFTLFGVIAEDDISVKFY